MSPSSAARQYSRDRPDTPEGHRSSALTGHVRMTVPSLAPVVDSARSHAEDQVLHGVRHRSEAGNPRFDEMDDAAFVEAELLQEGLARERAPRALAGRSHQDR